MCSESLSISDVHRYTSFLPILPGSSPDLFSPLLTSPHLTSPHLTSPRLLRSSPPLLSLTWRCGDDETWRKFEQRSDEQLLETLVREGGARRCPAGTCNYAFVWTEGDPRHYDCPACAASFCLECPAVGGGVGPAHPGVSCHEYVERLAADAEAKRRLDEWRLENGRADA